MQKPATTAETAAPATTAETAATADDQRNRILRAIAAILLAVLTLGIFYTLYFARQVLLPIFIALLLSFLLAPIIRMLARWRVPPPLGAGFIVAMLAGSLVLAGYQLSEPAMGYLRELPETAAKLAVHSREMKETVEEVQRAAKQAEEIATAPDGRPPTRVQVEESTIGDLVLSATWQTLLAALIVFALLYFLLASEHLFLTKLVSSLPSIHDKKRAVTVFRNIERSVGHYLLAYTINNLILALAVTAALWWLDMPNAVLFGVLAGMFNYVPYAGAVASTVIIGLSAVAVFDSVSTMIAPPLAFLVLTTIEGTLMQPLIVGRQMAMNPVAVFVALIFWSWLWGIPGALLAVPILAVAKAIFEQFPSLRPVAVFMSE